MVAPYKDNFLRRDVVQRFEKGSRNRKGILERRHDPKLQVSHRDGVWTRDGAGRTTEATHLVSSASLATHAYRSLSIPQDKNSGAHASMPVMVISGRSCTHQGKRSETRFGRTTLDYC